MTDDNSNLVDIPEDLASFRDTFLGVEKADPVVDTETDTLATDEDTDADAATTDEDPEAEESEDEGEDEDETESEEDEDESEDEPEPEDKPKGKKPSAQKRIDELTKNWRQEQREKQELLRRLEALETSARAPKESGTEDIKANLPQGAPTPDAVNEKGELKYPLGEFDPNFISDLMEFKVEQKTRELEQKRQAEHEAQQVAAAQEQLKADWAEKVAKAEEEIPDLREHLEDLVDVFQNIPPAYGEYLAATVMQCENGPKIMDYLSQNIGEAQKIVASGPAAATLAIGRLEARFSNPARSDAEEKRNKKPSKAPAPPVQQTRGSKGSAAIREDTEDLAAFKRVFLKP